MVSELKDFFKDGVCYVLLLVAGRSFGPLLPAVGCRRDNSGHQITLLHKRGRSHSPSTRHPWIAGDGNCLYLSVALQTLADEQQHQELRQSLHLDTHTCLVTLGCISLFACAPPLQSTHTDSLSPFTRGEKVFGPVVV